MKVRICYKGSCDGPYLVLTQKILEEAGFKIGEEVEVDIPMLGGGIVIHKIEQRHGEEVI